MSLQERDSANGPRQAEANHETNRNDGPHPSPNTCAAKLRANMEPDLPEPSWPTSVVRKKTRMDLVLMRSLPSTCRVTNEFSLPGRVDASERANRFDIIAKGEWN